MSAPPPNNGDGALSGMNGRGGLRGLAVSEGGEMSRGQSIPEYALLVSIAAAAVVAMQAYVRRGMQSEIKRLTDVVLAVKPQDATNASLLKRGELAQKAGMTNTEGSESVQDSSAESGYSVVREAPAVTTYDGLISRTRTSSASVFVDRTDLPPNFLLRSRVFGQLNNIGQEPIRFYPSSASSLASDADNSR